MSVNSNDYLVAPVALPDGATITSVVLYYINTDASVKINCVLYTNLYQSISVLSNFQGTTTATSSTNSSILSFNLTAGSGASNLINNSTGSYFLTIYPTTVWAANMSIKGVKITYTL